MWRIFYSWRFFLTFFWNFVLRDFSIVKICSMLILRLKNCFNLLVLRLKIFVLVIWLRVIGLELDFKMDANFKLEFGILIDSGSKLKFWNDLSTLVVYLGWLFAQLSWFCLFLNVPLKFWVWWLFCDHGYDWVCLIEMGMAKLVLLKFCNFWGQWSFFFFSFF